MKNLSFLKNINIAHKGIYDNDKIPENSIKAFELAIKKQIPIELDIHITKDNKIVVFHDNNLFRMTGVNKEIKKCTYKELLKLNLLNTTYSIPTLDEVLNLINGKVLLDIEIKNDNRPKDICNILIKKLENYKGKFVIKSFYPNIIYWLKINKPEYVRGILIPIHYKQKLLKLLKNKTNILIYTKPDFICSNKNLVKTKFIIKQRKKGKPIIAWTINNEKEKEKIKNYVDSYISNIKP